MPPKIWCVSNRKQHLVPSDPFSICGDTVRPAKSVRDLGIPRSLSGQRHVHEDSRVVDCIQLSCSSVTDTQHPSFRQSASFILSCHHVRAVSLTLRLTLFIGISWRLQDRLQSVLNVAARWWCASIENKTAAWSVRNCTSQNVLRSVWPFLCSAAAIARHQKYMSRDLQWAVDDDSRKWLRSAWSHKLVIRGSRLKTLGDRVFGVAAHGVWKARLLTSPLHSLYRPSKNTRRHIFVVIIIIIIIGYLLFLKAENTNITVEFYTRQMAGKRLSVGTLSDKWHNICDVPAHSIVIQSMQLTWTGFVTAASALQCPRESNLCCAVFYVWFIALFTKQFLYIDYV